MALPEPSFIVLVAYLALGSTSLGYLFLRTGWPKVRILEGVYKWGWSVLLGLIFTAIVAVLSAASSIAGTGLGAAELLLIYSTAGCGVAIAVLTVRRRFFGARKLRVSVPKEVAGAKVVAAKAVDMLKLDRGFIEVSGLQLGKIAEMREALARAEQQSTVGKEARAVQPEPEIKEAKEAAKAAEKKEVAKAVAAPAKAEQQPQPAGTEIGAGRWAAAEGKIAAQEKPKAEEAKKEAAGTEMKIVKQEVQVKVVKQEAQVKAAEMKIAKEQQAENAAEAKSAKQEQGVGKGAESKAARGQQAGAGAGKIIGAEGEKAAAIAEVKEALRKTAGAAKPAANAEPEIGWGGEAVAEKQKEGTVGEKKRKLLEELRKAAKGGGGNG